MPRMSRKGLEWILCMAILIVVERYGFGHSWGSTMVAAAAIAVGAFIATRIRRGQRKHPEDIQ